MKYRYTITNLFQSDEAPDEERQTIFYAYNPNLSLTEIIKNRRANNFAVESDLYEVDIFEEKTDFRKYFFFEVEEKDEGDVCYLLRRQKREVVPYKEQGRRAKRCLLTQTADVPYNIIVRKRDIQIWKI